MLDKNSWLQWLRRHGQFVRSGLGRTDVLGGRVDEEATQLITKDSPKERITNNAASHWLATYSSPWSTSYFTAFLEKHDKTIIETFNISWPRLNANLGTLCQRLLEKFERLERRLGRTRQPWMRRSIQWDYSHCWTFHTIWYGNNMLVLGGCKETHNGYLLAYSSGFRMNVLATTQPARWGRRWGT